MFAKGFFVFVAYFVAYIIGTVFVPTSSYTSFFETFAPVAGLGFFLLFVVQGVKVIRAWNTKQDARQDMKAFSGNATTRKTELADAQSRGYNKPPQ
jgi:energy-coupling factor transporter transmembrane protein EcfT